jgi:site-specific recombinase XerD
MTGKNIWRLCKVYGRLIGQPQLKPHDLRHGVAMEMLEQDHDLEQVRALLGASTRPRCTRALGRRKG